MKKITVDQSTAKLIAQTICAEIKSSIDKNHKTYEKAEKAERLYSQITDYMAKNQVCDNPWDGAADYFIPLTEWTVDAVWSRVIEALLTAEPYMTATGTANAQNITDFIDQILRDKVRLYENINFYFKQKLKLPFAVIKYDWCAKFDTEISKEPALAFAHPDGTVKHILPKSLSVQGEAAELIANGYQPVGQQEVWVTNDKELENQPKLKYIRFCDYVWSPDAKRDVRLYWEGDRFWMTLSEMRQEAKQERFFPDAVERVASQLDLKDKSGAEKAVAIRAQHIETYHWFGRLPFNKQFLVDFEDPEAIEQEVYCCVAIKDEELLQIEAWPYSRKPFPERVYIRGGFEETEEFEYRSLVDKLYQSQKELNTFFNTILNNAWLSMQKIFVKKKSLGGTEFENPEVYPGAIWEEFQTGDIRVLEVGDVKSIGIELQKMFLDFAERISNVSIYQVGAARREGGQKTLGEIHATISEANRGMGKFVNSCLNDLIKICRWTHSYYKDKMPPNIPRKARGENGQIISEPPQASIFKGVTETWEDRDLDGEPDFIWNGTLLNSSKELAIALANDLETRYLSQPMVAGSLLSTWEILKRGLVSRGVRDWDKILPPREAVIKEMQVLAASPDPVAPSTGPKVLGQAPKQNQIADAIREKTNAPRPA